jgi:hypothetical protein
MTAVRCGAEPLCSAYLTIEVALLRVADFRGRQERDRKRQHLGRQIGARRDFDSEKTARIERPYDSSLSLSKPGAEVEQLLTFFMARILQHDCSGFFGGAGRSKVQAHAVCIVQNCTFIKSKNTQSFYPLFCAIMHV